jgi:hypothetical protein
MKKSKQKSKDGRGGARPGAGGGGRWKHGRTKLVRLPVALLDEILEVARYMDQNDGNLPPPEASLITLGHPSKSLSGEEFKELATKRKAQEAGGKCGLATPLLRSCMNCQIPYGMSHRTCKQVLLVMASKPLESSKLFDIFFVPPHLQPAEGGGSVKGGKQNS